MHFLYGILFLMLTIILVAAYVIAFFLIIVGIQRIIRTLKIGFVVEENSPPAFGKKRSNSKNIKPSLVFTKKPYLIIIALVTLMLIYVYVDQRAEWMGKDSAHPTAKEYWVSGQVLASIRFAMVRVLHTENLLLRPFNSLQQVIYDKGIQYLPREDGEIGIWTDAWFLYPYTRRQLLPKVKVYTEHKRHLVPPVFKVHQKFPKIISFLDEVWFVMETMATKPIADDHMKVMDYYRNFPRLAIYYVLYDGFYTGRYTGSAKILLRDDFHIARLEQLLKWLEDLKVHWDEDNFYQTIWEKYPIVGAGRLIVQQAVLQDLLKVLAYKKEFMCDHPWVEKLYQSYLDVMSDDYSTNILLRYYQVNSRQASIMYEENMYSSTGEVGQYVLKHFCNRDLPEEKLLLISKRNYRSRWSSHAIEGDEAVRLIQEAINE